jgi:Domain of unknown function (DU1801)
MSEPKTKPTAVTLDEFLATTIDVSRHADCRAIAAMMQRATGEPPVMWGAIVGFGRYAYQYASGRKGEWPIVAFSPRKADYTIYIMPGFTHLADLLATLGKHKTAKACLYVKRLSDVDVNVLEKIIATSVVAMKSKKMRDAVGAV